MELFRKESVFKVLVSESLKAEGSKCLGIFEEGERFSFRGL